MIPKNRCAAGATLLIRGGAVPRTTPGYLGVWMVLAECSCRWCVGLGDRQEATGGGVLERRGQQKRRNVPMYLAQPTLGERKISTVV